MKDCSKDVARYHDDKVTLSAEHADQLRRRRDSNERRVNRGLKDAGDPKPRKFVLQGSFSMRTTIQEPNNDYDIDNGVVFTKESLRGERGADKSPLEARHMVRNAVDDGSFKQAPEVKRNCVRVPYNDGPHVDTPVYRESELGYELAGADWRVSDPEGVNRWFNQALSQMTEDGRAQCRQIIRLLKSFCVRRPSYSLPSGFVLTTLILEQYKVFDVRLDRALRDAMKAVRDRLAQDPRVRHPVVDEWLIDQDSSSKTERLRDLLSKAVNDLDDLDRPNSTRSRALKIWREVFATDYFDQDITDAEEAEKREATDAIGRLGSIPKPYGYFA